MAAKKPAPKSAAPKKPASTAVAKTAAPAAASLKLPPGSDIIVADQPAYLATMNTARGSENVGMEDLVIPRLEVIQALSPQVDPNAAEFDESFKQGDLTNSVTNQNYGREVMVIPIQYTKQWLVWKDRKQGGGFFGAYPNDQEAQDRAEQEGGEKAGVSVIDTPVHFCLLINRETGGVEEIVISMPRTKAKISRQWNTMVRLAGGDRFSRVYRVGTQGEKNQKGSYFNYTVAQSGFPVKQLYDRALALFEQLVAGQRHVVMDVKGMDGGGSDHSEEDGNTEM